MSEENQEIDPILQENLADTTTADPLLPKGDYEVEVVKLTQKRNSKDTGNYLNVQVKTVKEATSVTGELIPAGRHLFGMINLTPSEKQPAGDIQRNLKRFRVSCGCGETGSFYPLEQYTGMFATAKVGISKPTDDYPDEKNEIKGWVAKKN